MTPRWTPTSGASSVRIRRPTVLTSRWPWSSRPNRAMFVLSQSTSWFRCVVSRRLRIIALTSSLSSSTSPWASTWTERDDGDLLAQVAARDRGRDVGDVPHLGRQVGGHRVDVVGQVLPHPSDAGDRRLAAELAFGADLVGDPGHLAGEGIQLVDHRVDRVLELEDLALDVDGDLPAQVAAGDRLRDVGDVADLPGEVAGHRVDGVGQVLPCPADPLDVRLTAELAFRPDFARHPGHFAGEGVELVDHRVDRVREPVVLALEGVPAARA